MSNIELNEVCVGVRRYGEAECAVPEDLSRQAAMIGACVTCESCQVKLENQAFTDQLTGIGNRHAYEQTVEALKNSNTPMAVIHGDISSFKPVNDELGQATGDEVLKLIAALIDHEMREDDAFRVGGDEFTIVAALTRAPKDSPVGTPRTIVVPAEEREAAGMAVVEKVRHGLATDNSLSLYREQMQDPEALLMNKVNFTIYDPEVEPTVTAAELSKRAEPKGPEAQNEPREEHIQFAETFTESMRTRRKAIAASKAQ